MTKIAETDSVQVLTGGCMGFGTSTNTPTRLDNIAAPDTDRTTYTYNNGNELLTMVKDSGTTTFTYDDWGRQVSKIVGANSAVYTYRFGSMLKEINSTIPGEADLVQYTYDAFNKRREVRVTEASVVTSDQWYRYDIGFNAIARYDDGDLTDWVVGTRNQTVTYTGMTPLSEVPGSNPSSGSYRHYVHDHLGSTCALYDGSKVLLARQAYTPYGEQAASTAGVEATYSYTGKPWEDETGLYFFPYRYYSPDASRWAWRDPAGMVDGPNMYFYVSGLVTSATDPLGLSLRNPCEIERQAMLAVCTVSFVIDLADVLICAGCAAACLAGPPACIACLAVCAIGTGWNMIFNPAGDMCACQAKEFASCLRRHGKLPPKKPDADDCKTCKS